MTLPDIYSQLKSQFPSLKIFQNHPLAPYTTLKIGGPADIFIDISTQDQMISILNFVNKTTYNKIDAVKEANGAQSSEVHTEGVSTGNSFTSRFPITILGNGSNILISDSGIRGIVIRYFQPLQPIILDTLSQNLVGLENFAYIPASLGGAIVSNIHGVDKTNFNQYLHTITVYDLSTSTIYDLQSNHLRWSYDYSEFQNKPNLVILSATFNLQSGDGKLALEKYHQIIAEKTISQPINSAGCVFKNLPNDSTGRIIDQELHLKGFSIGGAQISPLHANFIVNTGNCTSKDYLSLTRHIQSLAKSKLNLDLELEIKLLGDFSS